MSNKDLKYKYKYLKYKNKYLDLQSQIGGSPPSIIDDVPSTTVEEKNFSDLPEDLQKKILTLVGDVPIFNKTLGSLIREQTLQSFKTKLRLPESEEIENMFMSGPIEVYHPEYLSDAETGILAKIFMTNISKLQYQFINYMIPNPNPNPGRTRFHLIFLINFLRQPLGNELKLSVKEDSYLNDNQLHFELFFIFICILIKKEQLEAAALSKTQPVATSQTVTQVSPDEIKKFNIRITIENINLSLFTKSFNSIIFGLKNNLIKQLTLSSTSIGVHKAEQLANALQTNTTLLFFAFMDNPVGILAFAEALSKITITNLVLNFNQIGDDVANVLANALKENTTLTTLDLGSNNIGDEGGKALLDALETNTTLRTLELDNNNCSDEIKRNIKNKLARNAKIP